MICGIVVEAFDIDRERTQVEVIEANGKKKKRKRAVIILKRGTQEINIGDFVRWNVSNLAYLTPALTDQERKLGIKKDEIPLRKVGYSKEIRS